MKRIGRGDSAVVSGFSRTGHAWIRGVRLQTDPVDRDRDGRADSCLTSCLMDKYADTPMDFADATLVLLAEELGVLEVLTLDRRGFSTYRTAKGKPFRLVLP